MVALAAPLGYAACGLVLLRAFLSWAPPLLYLLRRRWRSLEDGLQSYHHYKVPRYDESLRENPLYRSAAAYISSLPSLEDSDYANIFSSTRTSAGGGGDHLSLRLEDGRTVEDSFLGARVSWTNLSDAALVLRIRHQDRQRVLRPYLDHVGSVAEEVERRRRDLRLYTNCAGGGAGRRWTSVPFTHPATLDALAMDAALKGRVRSDLESFLKSRSLYHRLGRVWKRSYLLYGPTGTSKSSFAAAMARFLGYDVYDLDLAHAAADGSDLNALLLQTTPRSVILVEDLDRYLQTAPGAGLPGMLRFMDGVFSCCGEERVMVFTMNGVVKERVDPAVLRPGRADVHIYFALCDFGGFKAMAGGYLGIKDHRLYPQVEAAFQGGARLSHAEMGEIMLANRGSPSRALKAVIGALRRQQRGVGTAEATTASPLQAEEEPPSSGRDASAGNTRKLYGQITLRRDSRGGFRRLFRRKSNRTEK